jgi:hypothetical protein
MALEHLARNNKDGGRKELINYEAQRNKLTPRTSDFHPSRCLARTILLVLSVNETESHDEQEICHLHETKKRLLATAT